MSWAESRTLWLLSLRNKSRCRRRLSCKNRMSKGSPQPQGKRKWRSSTLLEMLRCLRVIYLLSRRWEPKVFFRRPSNKWTSNMTRSKEWTKLCFTPKSLPLETSSFRNPNNLNKNILRSRRSLISWWKSKDLRDFNWRNRGRLREQQRGWLANKLS